MKKIFKMKRLIIFVILFSAISYGMDFIEDINKKKRLANGVFRFDDYENAESAKKAILKSHPIGSVVDDLIKTMKKAGDDTKCFGPNFLTSLNGKLMSDPNREEYSLACNYKSLYSLFRGLYLRWNILIDFDEEKRSIRDIQVLRSVDFIKLVPDVAPTTTQNNMLDYKDYENIEVITNKSNSLGFESFSFKKIANDNNMIKKKVA